MKKTQIIKNTVGEKLKDYGFCCLKTEGSCRIFMREAHGYKRYYDPETDVVKQYVNIQESDYGMGLTVRFETDAVNGVSGDDVEFLKEKNPNKLSANKRSSWFFYSGEEDYKRVLLYLADLIIEYGLEHLDRMSIEEEVIPTKAMADELFENHTELDRQFLEKYKFNTVAHSMADIEDWFQKLKELIISVSEKPYEEVKELLLEMAAFIGERHCELIGAKWFFEEYMHTPFTQKENHRGRLFLGLEDVIRCYESCKKKEEVSDCFMDELLGYEEAYEKKNGDSKIN
ncbi:hypothetical protein AALA90_19925 [Lachnospiraceae bacterium 38-10]